MAKYSIVFHPSDAVIETVKELKQQLSDKIGWFPSKNSLAHITICEFDYDSDSYMKIAERLSNFAQYKKPFDVTFNSFNNYTNGAFFIAPEQESKLLLAEIMKEIPKIIQFPVTHKSSNPHISIGRQLKPEQLKTAYNLVSTIQLQFVCSGITIRKFNTERKQYDILETIPFESKIPPIENEWTLF
ncbi:2'-5' RNA ligase family protein [Flavobacterium channae]|uniref:2'-5' RNA ligase family protein n=1 Tax=Flavobacterium channae TaxID=2897181 RepID=UPI001E4EABBE|nr:2'-5' RNA ligase family protein [Flavobacterium channae]UGS22904.1 2'-5' RNA ligase family protein [Flavobacterium channae]